MTSKFCGEHWVKFIPLPDFRQYCKATEIKMVQYWHKNRHMGQWNTVESPETNPHMYSQLIFNKRGKNIKWEKVSSASGAGKFEHLHGHQ